MIRVFVTDSMLFPVIEVIRHVMVINALIWEKLYKVIWTYTYFII